MQFQLADISDLPKLIKINQQASVTPCQTFAIERFVKKGNCLIVIEHQQLAGFILFQVNFELLDIVYLTVATKFQRQGLAQALVAQLLVRYKQCELILEVRPSNTAAINLYKKLFFIEIDRRKNYYRHPTEDALIFKRY